jgi:hypothetical protein
MNIRDKLAQLQGVLMEAKPCPGGDPSGHNPFVAGNFGNRSAEFGCRKAKDGSTAVFFRIKMKPVEDLPLPLKEDCPVVFPEGSEFENVDVRIEDSQWLTEIVRPEEGSEHYFSSQTDASIRERLTALSRLVLNMETGAFSLQPTIDAHVKMNIQRLFRLMAGGFVMIVLSIVAVSAPFFAKSLKIPEAKEDHSGNASLRSTRIARAQAELAMNERSIMPPGANVFLMVTPDKTTVPLGGEVTLLYEILTRYSTKCWGFNNEGEFRNFRAERKDAAAGTPRVVVQANGKKFLKFAVGTVSLVPQRTGEQLVYPGTAFVSARAESGKILDVYLTAKSVAIRVVKDAGQERG